MKRALSVERLLQWAYHEKRVRGLPSRPLDENDDDDDDRGHIWTAPEVTLDQLAADMDALSDQRRIDVFVSRLSKNTRHLLRDHAIACTQPDWRKGARHRMAPRQWVRFEQLGVADETHPPRCACRGLSHLCTVPYGERPVWRKGEKVVMEHERDPPHPAHPPIYVPIVEVDIPADVRKAREDLYLRWRAGLEVIRDSVKSGALALDEHTVTDELPRLTPWISSARKLSVDGALMFV